MNTWHIHIQGQVQGVGFRPFVYALAREYDLVGWVNNTVDGVHISFNATPQQARAFKAQLIDRAPPLSQITSISLTEEPQRSFSDFQIVHSEDSGARSLLLTPDFGLCADCREEVHQPENRRNGYPFITCTNCGPRFSIVNSLPYDRENTTMDAFHMCEACSEEYSNPNDRRYYSQTNSCSECGIDLKLFDANGQLLTQTPEEAMRLVVSLWEKGKIVAIKGIGGYLLTCDASNRATVEALRKRKHRPSKPLALMYPALSALSAFQPDQKALQEVQSPVSPIVLMDLKAGSNVISAIAPGLNQIGVMLPYTPLYELLLKQFGKPIVATSGNVSNAPIVFRDEEALNGLVEIADFILANNREIVVPQDDSVVRYTFFEKQRIVLRRSRGLAPNYIHADLRLSDQQILAMGGMLKGTFCLLHQQNTYLSQYLGDLEHFDTQQNYRHTLAHVLRLFDARPEVILIDGHPEYPSSQHGQQLSAQRNIPAIKIQHHIAHFGAVLGEHNLMHTDEPVLGVVWDGTGLGEDDQIWGGEFFRYQQYDFLRCSSFDYFDFILGDKMPREPRISALSACRGILGAEEWLKEKFSQTEWRIYNNLLGKANSLQTSSVGRLFDAVASLLGIMDKQTYEGEAAMRLEALASTYFQNHGLDFASSYFEATGYYHTVPTKSLMTRIMLDLRKGVSTDFIAAKFHFSLVQLVKTIADNQKTGKIAFSGGVFQNGLLVDLMHHHLKAGFDLYFHEQLAPNDENISFGQLICYHIQQHKETLEKNKSNDHVFSDSR